MDHDQSVLDFYQEEEPAIKTSTNSKLDYWIGQADNLALSQNKVMAVVNTGSYQVWPIEIVSKDYKIVYKAGGGTCS